MVVSYGGIFIGKRRSVKFRSVIVIRGGIIACGRIQCFTFVRRGAASCLVEGGGQRKGMRSQVIIVRAIPSLIPGLDGRTHRWGRINTQKYGDPWYKFVR